MDGFTKVDAVAYISNLNVNKISDLRLTAIIGKILAWSALGHNPIITNSTVQGFLRNFVVTELVRNFPSSM
jgi:hypothetical protein